MAVIFDAANAATVPETYNAAVAALESNEPARAIELLVPIEQSVNADTGQLALIRLALSQAYLRSARPADARDVLKRIGTALDETPQAAAVAALRGDAERLLGARSEAELFYSQVVERAGGGTLARYAKARILELKGVEAEQGGEFASAAAFYLDAGDALLGLGLEDKAYYTDARALFEKVARGSGNAAQNLDWRGEPTARAVYSLGELERAQGHLPEALAYYQRTFVSWLKYPQWPARAYLRAAECMDKLGKRRFAMRHLEEMIRKRDKFGTLPEYQEAKKQLRIWTAELEGKEPAKR